MNRLPVCIRRFKPIEVLKFDPDKPIGYQEHYAKITIHDANEVVALGELLFKAEQEAWEGKHARAIIETVIDGALNTLTDVLKYLERNNSPEARQVHRNLTRLIVSMKFPLIACIGDCLGAIYLKDGMPAVRRAIEKLTKGEVD